jgi:hypothetical protein
MENSFVLIVLLFAALATGGLIANWMGLGPRDVPAFGFCLCRIPSAYESYF